MRRILVTGGSGFIGTNLVEALLQQGEREVLSLDISSPKVAEHQPYFQQCDLLDRAAMTQAFTAFRPTHVVHLGGRTDMLGSDVSDYAANHVGTQNVIAAIEQCPTIERVVFTSSQFVFGPGALPTNDLDFRPHTIYGESKVQSEKAVRAAKPSYVWTIIRPTNVWGKWHPRYPYEFWRVLKQGRYVHPGGERVIRCYAYVGTVVKQICAILELPPEVVNGEVFYVGDQPIDLLDWTNAFSLELVGKPVRVVPRAIVKGIAKVGDVVVALGGKFPIFTSRYKSMTESYVTPMQKTFDKLGVPNGKLNEGVKETVAWLRTQGEFWK